MNLVAQENEQTSDVEMRSRGTSRDITTQAQGGMWTSILGQFCVPAIPDKRILLSVARASTSSVGFGPDGRPLLPDAHERQTENDGAASSQTASEKPKRQEAVSLFSSGVWDPRSAGNWGEVTSWRGCSFSWAADCGGDGGLHWTSPRIADGCGHMLT
ncbi:hypothetical protein LA080_010215 [Diaporthe eres]|nr:hypothetical protein LA080_010215 [Diaporthe eres]